MAGKILHILLGLGRGGCEGNALCLIEQSPEWEHHVLVLGSEGDMSDDFVAAGAVVTYRRSPSKWPWRLSADIRECLAKVQPDGVIVWHGMVMLPTILHALRDLDITVLVHGGNPALSMPRSVDARYWILEKVLGRRASATYVCCSSHVANSFAGSHYLSRFPRKVVPNGALLPSVPAHEFKVLQAKDPCTIGMVARLDSIKDHGTLLRAFTQVLKVHPHARLELAGDGEQRAALECLATELGIADQVCFLGVVTHVYEVIREWDVFAYATTDREGLGNALVEAMMMGLPCVATDVGPMREVAGEPAAVVLVKPACPPTLAAGILTLLNDRDERQRLGTAARQRALSEFSPAIYAQRYLQLLFP